MGFEFVIEKADQRQLHTSKVSGKNVAGADQRLRKEEKGAQQE